MGGFKLKNAVICVQFVFGYSFALFSHKTAFDGRSSPISLVSRKNNAKQYRNYFDCDCVVANQNANNLSLRDFATLSKVAKSWQSKIHCYIERMRSISKTRESRDISLRSI